MQRCKYLDDLGLDRTQYGTNFVADNDERAGKWKKERKKYGFDSRETWNLNRMFIEWIYTRVKMYKKQVTGVINLSYHKIPYKGEKITQKKAINKILSLAEEILVAGYSDSEDELFYENSREICELWKELFPYMWW